MAGRLQGDLRVAARAADAVADPVRRTLQLTVLRIVVVAAVSLVALALLAAPERFPGPIRQLAQHSLNTPDPVPTAQLDVGALRRAASLLPARATYAVVAPPNDPQLAHDLQAVAQLLFLPALSVAEPSRAEWLLRYQAAPPAAVEAVRTYQLGNGVVLERLRP